MTPGDAQSLFGFWRSVVMGNRRSRKRLASAVGGYFFECAEGDGSEPTPIPLGVVRQSLLKVLTETDLTDEERSVVRLYFGLDGLPLPFSSKAEPDIAAGRDESSPRGTVKAAMAKVAVRLEPRPLDSVPARRGVVNPLLEAWFRSQVRRFEHRQVVVARAYVQAVARCDGPHGPPTVVALRRWYRDCGVADPDLVAVGAGAGERPNGNSLARAAALMEVALFDEVAQLKSRWVDAQSPPLPHGPGPGPVDPAVLAESVTHPDLVALVGDEVSPASLIAAATLLKGKALSGEDVTGQLALFLRTVRPRLVLFTAHEFERLAAAITYVAASVGDPFLSLEMLGQFLRRAGVTDRTFTVLVNSSEAASAGGYHALAARIDRLSVELRRQWRIPKSQIPLVEHTEAEQQYLAASAFRHEQLGAHLVRSGDVGGGVSALRQSADLAVQATVLAERVLTDTSTFRRLEVDGKEGDHGGDLTWPWFLAAVLRITEPLTELASVARTHPEPDRELQSYITSTARFAQRSLNRYDGDLDRPYYQHWHSQIQRQARDLLR